MINGLKYSFDDEVASSTLIDFEKRRFKVCFSRYYDLGVDKYIERPTCWLIEGWQEAGSKLSSSNKWEALETNFGVISMILSAEFNVNVLFITVNTSDNRYVDLMFKGAQHSLVDDSL
jgi:hypothetical protein